MVLRVFIRISLSLLFVVGSVSWGVGGVFIFCVDDETSPTNGSGQASAYGVDEQNNLQDLASGIRLGSWDIFHEFRFCNFFEPY